VASDDWPAQRGGGGGRAAGVGAGLPEPGGRVGRRQGSACRNLLATSWDAIQLNILGFRMRRMMWWATSAR